MGQRSIVGLVALALLTGLSLQLIGVDRNAGTAALTEARSFQPQGHWSVVRQSFEPWANDVRRGPYRYTGGGGPAWVIELTAPSDATWRNYTAVVVVSAVDGGVSGASVLASNTP